MTDMQIQQDAKIYVPGHRGLVGAAIVKRLRAGGYRNLLLRPRAEVDLTDRAAVTDLFETERPEFVFDAAAKVGGIQANDRFPADFIRDNILIQMNVIDAAYRAGVRKFLFLGSSCIYPKLAPQPLKEEYLLEGYLEATNEPYAIAKIAGIKLCEAYRDQYGCNFISAMPTNLYGPNDNYDLKNSHVLPALLRKFHTAVKTGHSSVEIWGSGQPRREFMHVDDLAEACLFLMEHYNEKQFVNIGVGTDVSIRELAEMIASITGFGGALVFDPAMPDGTPRKLMDVSRLHNLGWRHKIDLNEGITAVYQSVRHEEWFAIST